MATAAIDDEKPSTMRHRRPSKRKPQKVEPPAAPEPVVEPELEQREIIVEDTVEPPMPILVDPEPEPAPPPPAAPEWAGVQIGQPAAFDFPEMRKLFAVAFAPHPDGIPRPNPFDALDWCRAYCTDPTTAVIVASQHPTDAARCRFRGLLVLDYNPGAAWSLGAFALHYYSDGPEARAELCKSAIAWLQGRGLNRLFGFNLMGVSDEAHARFFGEFFDARPFASLMELQIKG